MWFDTTSHQSYKVTSYTPIMLQENCGALILMKQSLNSLALRPSWLSGHMESSFDHCFSLLTSIIRKSGIRVPSGWMQDGSNAWSENPLSRSWRRRLAASKETDVGIDGNAAKGLGCPTGRPIQERMIYFIVLCIISTSASSAKPLIRASLAVRRPHVVHDMSTGRLSLRLPSSAWSSFEHCEVWKQIPDTKQEWI